MATNISRRKSVCVKLITEMETTMTSTKTSVADTSIVASTTSSNDRNKTLLSKTSKVDGSDEPGGFGFKHYYVPSYFGNKKETEKDYDWNEYMDMPMSEQHKFIAKIKIFCENRFDIVILGKSNEKNKRLGNMIFKCFLNPLGKEIEDYIGDQYAGTRGDTNLTLALEDTTESRAIKDMLAVKEDSLRYSQIKVVKVYGLGLRIHVAASTDKSETIAQSVTKQQIQTMANYLSFKKKFKSGYGMNTFLVILDYNGKLPAEGNCMIELFVKLFSLQVFNSVIFLVEVELENIDKTKEIMDKARNEIAQKASCRKEIIEILQIKPLTERMAKAQVNDEGMLVGETVVASAIKIFDAISRQTYMDPNPFEPDGMDYHDAVAITETIKKKYQLKEMDWCTVVNHIYTMVPN